jgi:dihydroneopterin aldolase / 2-amino-4-hydroxy-6-hydroxymethyldihydropteridine diphosphokinase
MGDHIEVRGLRVVGIIGVLSEERRRAQPFEVDLDIELDLTEAARSDALAATINYAVPVEAVEAIIRTERHELLERVAGRIVEEVLGSDPRVFAVEATVRKLHPPLPADVSSTGVRLRRTRADVHELARPATRAFIAMGSNLGDRLAYLAQALRSLPGLASVSQVYETDPVGGPDNQGPYLNLVAEIQTSLDPFALLSVCHRLEQQAGRIRTETNGPRTLDVDVLLYGDTEIRSAELTVPHPRMFERRFVVQPLSDLAPELCPLGWMTSLDPGGVRRVGSIDLTTL